ncbi:MAG TPA: rhodanese-related sulfurtransferase [Gammaproteobacteria bacterium]
MHAPSYTVAAFYKFVALADPQELRERLHSAGRRLHIKGTVLLAAEGINGTIAGDGEAVAGFLRLLRDDPRLADLEHKESFAHAAPFARLKVRIKREIVTLGRPEADPNRQVGVYVEPRDWNRLIEDPDVLLLDTRNAYEYALGSFAGAADPGTRQFREFPNYVARALGSDRDRPIATFCTGGIRCEKATAFLLAQGFTRVYHLKGGILKYLEEIAPEESLWRGECFVFDERVAVGHGLRPGIARLCADCGWAISGDGPCPQCQRAAAAG